MCEQYADVDTIPLRAPSDWIQSRDLEQWNDIVTGASYGPDHNSSSPVSLILGIEADTDGDSDSYWRMGYTYPVQLTQWALAGAPDQAVLSRFLGNFEAQMRDATTRLQEDIGSMGSGLGKLDPLELTGPAAITKAAMEYMAESTGLRWQALSGLADGGRSKVVVDTMILPITGFRYEPLRDCK